MVFRNAKRRHETKACDRSGTTAGYVGICLSQYHACWRPCQVSSKLIVSENKKFTGRKQTTIFLNTSIMQHHKEFERPIGLLVVYGIHLDIVVVSNVPSDFAVAQLKWILRFQSGTKLDLYLQKGLKFDYFTTIFTFVILAVCWTRLKIWFTSSSRCYKAETWSENKNPESGSERFSTRKQVSSKSVQVRQNSKRFLK